MNPINSLNLSGYQSRLYDSSATESHPSSGSSGDLSIFSQDDAFVLSSGLPLSEAKLIKDASSDAEPVTITIISTNDLHGKYDDMPKLAGVVEALKKKYPDAILVDCGDSTYNPPFSSNNKFEPMTKILNEMDYDFISLGNHEFQFGKESAVNDFVNKLEAQALSANVHDEKVGGYLDNVKPYEIRNIDGLNVAFVGLVKPKMHTKANPHVGKDLVKESTIQAMDRIMPELREKADVIIALTHQGLGEDERMVRSIRDIDLIIGAHDHKVTDKPIVCGAYPGKTYIVESGSHAKFVGVSQLTVDPDTNEVLDFKFKQYPVQTYGVKPDREVAEIINAYVPVDPDD